MNHEKTVKLERDRATRKREQHLKLNVNIGKYLRKRKLRGSCG